MILLIILVGVLFFLIFHASVEHYGGEFDLTSFSAGGVICCVLLLLLAMFRNHVAFY